MHILRPILLILVWATIATAQSPGSQSPKLHPYLLAQLQQGDPDAMLPVYFVLRNRLGYDHWFPRVQGMPLQQRRALVVAELQDHANETQAGLLEYLREAEMNGEAERVLPNWVGNLVQVRATAAIIVEAAGRGEVERVWFDYAPPLDEVEDGAQGPVTPVTAGAEVGPLVGNGPESVNAQAVWNRGIRGQGVLIMNADSGVNVQHGDLSGRMWHNPGEIPGNGQDDDGNGLVDDIHGWNYGLSSGDLNDGGGHGTSVAGAIVGDGSCSGTIFGPAPAATLMAARLDSEASQWAAVQYAIAKGADVFNSSHSYKLRFNPPPNYQMHREVGDVSLAAGLIRTNSTSNDGTICQSGVPSSKPCNIAAPGNLPPPYLDPNQILRGQISGVIGVGAWNWRDDVLEPLSPCGPFGWSLADVLRRRPDYDVSTWDSAQHEDYPWNRGASQGLLKPDVVGPSGVTTTSGGGTGCATTVFVGTSAATPITAGVIALWKCANPSLTPEDVGMIVHQSSRDRGAIPGKENDWGAGVIDALAGLKMAQCVNRVNGTTVWDMEHSVSQPISLQVDGLPNAPASIAIGFARETVDIGPADIGIGNTTITLWVGTTDASGNGGTGPIPLDPSLVGLKVYTQAMILDTSSPGEFRPRVNRSFPLGELLTSNVVGVQFSL